MAFSRLSDVFGRWTGNERYDYTKMKSQPNNNRNPGPRTSFVESLDNRERFSQWPNFSIEQEYQNQHDRRSSTDEILFTTPTSMSKPGRCLQLMCIKYPIRDMAWATGIVFTIGSALFVINGFFLVLPVVAPNLTFATEASYAAPITSLAGGIIFVVGGLAGYLEGLNAKRGGGMLVTQGIRVDREVSSMEVGMKSDEISLPLSDTSSSDNISLRQTPRATSPSVATTHPRHVYPSDTYPSDTYPTTNIYSSATQTVYPNATSHNITNATPQLAMRGSPTFIWIPSLRQLSTHYLRDQAFMGALIQFIGTFIFLFAIITGLPGVMDLTNIPILFLWNLFPATLGGVLFVTASTLQMLSAQDKWYVPKPLSVEWHLGASNLIGSIGFTLAGALPYFQTADASLQASLASLWGSWAFLVGSFLQWYCAMGKYA